MYEARIQGSAPADNALASMEGALATLAGGLDARFVEAGNALARAYEIVEKLVGALESVTNALDREMADAAIAKMRMTADRLMRLPQMQADRAQALATIQQASRALETQVKQVNRLLSFLRICGLNIKVAAAGMTGFSELADTIFTKLDWGESEVANIGHEVELLAANVPGILDIERRLASECAKVIPHVPLKLADDALALQQHQSEAAARAARIATVAREVSGRVGTALGALQIGDITRQRLEHVADGLRGLDALFVANPGLSDHAADAIRGHLLALLAAQAEDTMRDLARESGLLGQSVRAIAPGAKKLLDLKNAGEGGDGDSALLVVERSVAEVASVTGQLQDADIRSNALSATTSEAAERLAQRLRHIHRITEDVQHMAWNTDLRCYRMGPEGRALAMVAAEIRGFANRLEENSQTISDLFDQIADAAGSIRDPDGGDSDAGQALGDSLASIRDGGDRLREGLAGLDREASAVVEILDATISKVDCEQAGATLATIVAELSAHAAPCADPPEEARAPLSALLATIMRSYTMASEREIHRGFALAGEVAEAPAAVVEDDDDDDGLF